MWLGSEQEVKYTLNKDFIAPSMAAPEIQALMQLWQSGGIGFEDLLDNLKRGEIVADDRKADDIIAENETTPNLIGNNFDEEV